jgi:hypothetical protein
MTVSKLKIVIAKDRKLNKYANNPVVTLDRKVDYGKWYIYLYTIRFFADCKISENKAKAAD